MLDSLTKFYQSAGIYSCEFQCKHCDCCKAAAKKKISGEKKSWEEGAKRLCEKEAKLLPSDDLPKKLLEEKQALLRHGQFIEASSAYVGPKYESNDSGCRLLFLSLDPGSDESSDTTWPREFRGLWDRKDDSRGRRTPEGMREWVIRGLESDGLRRTWVHWYGTHLLAARILREAADGPASEIFRVVCGVLDDKDQTRKEKELVELVKVTPYFAHANVVKCSIGKLGNAQAPDQMYRNCTGYLKGELPILKPDIIVAQGREAAQALDEESEEFGQSPFNSFNHRLQYLALDGKRPKDVLLIKTIHPRNGVFKTEGGPRWRDFTGAAREFMAEKRRLQ